MKGQAADWISLCPIFSVTGNRVSDPLTMSADLILSAGLQLELYQSVRYVVDFLVSESLAMRSSKLPILTWRFFRGILRP